jgi:hypothetical protein
LHAEKIIAQNISFSIYHRNILFFNNQHGSDRRGGNNGKMRNRRRNSQKGAEKAKLVEGCVEE